VNIQTKNLILKKSGTYRGQPIAGFEEFVLPVIEKILKSSRHLSATRLGTIASTGGIDYSNSVKTRSAAAIAVGLFGYSLNGNHTQFTKHADPVAVEGICRRLRFSANGWSRSNHTYGEPAPVESDREYIQDRLAELNASGAEGNYRLRDEKRTLEASLKALGEGVGNFTLDLDSRVKFHAALEALQQYIDNGKDADHLSDDPALQAKLEAASCLRDQLDAVLASLAR
jgi:hypothetical protein